MRKMSLPEPTRRVFLKRSLQGLGGFVSLPLVSMACSDDAQQPAPTDLETFTPGEFQILRAATEVFMPRGGAYEMGAQDVELARRIDRDLAAYDADLVGAVKAALWMLEWGGGLLAKKLGRFSRMSIEERVPVIGTLPYSVGLARDVFAGLKGMFTFYFYAADETWSATGYDGPLVQRKAVS